MKKMIAVLVGCSMLWGSVTAFAADGLPGDDGIAAIYAENEAAEEETQETGVEVVFQEEIMTKNGVSYIPLRQAADSLGLSLTWDKEERAAVLCSEMRSMKLTEGVDLYVSTAAQEGMIGMTAPMELGAAPFVDENGKMYVPAEAFSVLVGYEVTEGEGGIVIYQRA